MIDLDAEKIIFAIKINNLNTEISAKKAMVALVFEIDNGNIHIAMALLNPNTMILFQ